jgi:hypothetical protein
MRSTLFVFSLLIGAFSLSLDANAVTKEALLQHVAHVGEDLRINGNSVNFTYRGVPEILVFDENADRMRIVSPIIEVQKVDDALLLQTLEANFHSVLDVRYAASNDMIWSAFIHPLSDLSVELLYSAISQVAIAHASFGQEFTSGAAIFPATK